ncbi:MAG: hypothetical protein ACSLFM_11385 [Tepidiformaceae bacterium]
MQDYVQNALITIREQIAATDSALAEARSRRDLVLTKAKSIVSSDRTFTSGSLAHGTVNQPVNDADCGIVLRGEDYPDHDPEQTTSDPEILLRTIQDQLGPITRAWYPDARVRVTKRAIKVEFHQPLDDVQDPSVDLIVGFDRVGEPGLWIPNTDQARWDPSDPERHTELFRLPDEPTARVRRRAIRLAKAWNRQFSEPSFCSFNIEAFGLYAIDHGMSESDALRRLFAWAECDLKRGLTRDPAGVSRPIKLTGDRTLAIQRLELASARMLEALGASDPAAARAALERIFWTFELPGIDGSSNPSAASVARLLVGGGTNAMDARSVLGPSATGRQIPPRRAFGE